jgi:DNA-binding response OmpR family regulator
MKNFVRSAMVAIMNHIMRIRKKLGEDFVVTVRGIGYKIDE